MPEGLNITKPEGHLNFSTKGARPIMACIGTPKDFQESGVNLEKPSESLKLGTNMQNVEFQGIPTVSILDDSNKYSKKLFGCVGLIVTGIVKGTSKNISFLSHQDPATLNDNITSLRKLLDEMKDKCEVGTIDAVIVGGNSYGANDRYGRQIYLNSTLLLGKEVQKVLGFEPIVINDAKTNVFEF